MRCLWSYYLFPELHPIPFINYILQLSCFTLYSSLISFLSTGQPITKEAQIETVISVIICHSSKIIISKFLKCGYSWNQPLSKPWGLSLINSSKLSLTLKYLLILFMGFQAWKCTLHCASSGHFSSSVLPFFVGF